MYPIPTLYRVPCLSFAMCKHHEQPLPMLPVAELELVPGQQISSDEVMNLAKILAPFWSHFRRDCGPFAPFGPELQAYCNEIARGNPPPIKPLKCPDCGAEVRVVIGKKPGRAGIYIFFVS